MILEYRGPVRPSEIRGYVDRAERLIRWADRLEDDIRFAGEFVTRDYDFDEGIEESVTTVHYQDHSGAPARIELRFHGDEAYIGINTAYGIGDSQTAWYRGDKDEFVLYYYGWMDDTLFIDYNLRGRGGFEEVFAEEIERVDGDDASDGDE